MRMRQGRWRLPLLLVALLAAQLDTALCVAVAARQTPLEGVLSVPHIKPAPIPGYDDWRNHDLLQAGASLEDGVVVFRSRRHADRNLVACAPGCNGIMMSAANFGTLAATTITNSGNSLVQGDMGVSPGSAITGFPPGTCSGTIHITTDGVPATAQSDANTVYNNLNALPITQDMTGVDLGGHTLGPGKYYFAGSGGITAGSTLVLDAAGNKSATFIFQMATTLIVEGYGNVTMINGAQSCNVFFTTGSSAAVAAYASFAGNVLAWTSVALANAATMQGTLVALQAAVTLVNNQFQSGTPIA